MDDATRIISGFLALLGGLTGAAFLGKGLLDLYWEKVVGTGELVGGFFLLVALLGGLMVFWGRPGGYVFLLVLLGVGPLLSFLRRRGTQRAMDQWAQKDIEQCWQLLQFDPNNGAAYLRLAEIYEKVGRYDEAIEALHTAMQRNLADAGAEFRLNRLLKRKRLEELGLVVCSHCGEEQARGTRVCSSCGARFPLLR